MRLRLLMLSVEIRVPKIIAEAVKVTALEKRLIEEYFPKLVSQFDTRLWEGSAMFLELIGFRPDCLRTYRPPEVPHPQKICALDTFQYRSVFDERVCMAFENLQDLIYFLDRNKLLAHVIKELDPYLEISEVSDRVVKRGDRPYY